MKRVGRLEKYLVSKVLHSEFRSSKAVGMLQQAEKEFADLIGTSNAIGVVNGTATLHIALEALGIGQGDEVIVPALTMSATSFAVLHANATPIFADIDPLTWQIDPNSVKKLIGPKTKAIITVALYGGSPDYHRLREVARHIPLIEDNAQAMGTTYGGDPLGGFGVFSSYSFQSSKHLSAGEGGMLCTNDDVLADQARLVQTLGYSAVKQSATRKIPKSVIQNPAYLRHESLGWNYRMSELVAAVVIGQTRRANKLVRVRKRAARQLLEVLRSVPWLVPQKDYPGVENSYWALAVAIDTDGPDWLEFRNRFVQFGGRGVYSAWAVGYMETAYLDGNLLGREHLLTRDLQELTREGQAPIAESVQPRILAFRTNEWSRRGFRRQAQALERTIASFAS